MAFAQQGRPVDLANAPQVVLGFIGSRPVGFELFAEIQTKGETIKGKPLDLAGDNYLERSATIILSG
jgi:hypothetical protein